jgi:mono/diheme cytochrome c family protein
VSLLKNGVSPQASVTGPMAEVVFRSTQHLSMEDLQAMAVFLKQLPLHDEPPRVAHTVDAGRMARGQKIYADQCAQCHGERGEGKPGAYPALAGNRAVTLQSPANLVRIVVSGGYPPSTSGNPRPYGMPPFSQTFNDEDIASVLTYIRNAWGHSAPQVTELDVHRYR